MLADESVRSPEDVVQAQLDAYNAHDTDRFVACYAEDVRVAGWPSNETRMEGRYALAAFYRLHRFNRPELKADLQNRIVFGNTVIDHEIITGLEHHTVTAVAIYRVDNNLISSVHFVERPPVPDR
ncbi:nuclear transport factor 2 family protein [Silvimonas iriomotensis]|nr:nuclear transport factor 2 family protein [Silvimonas iriomotensis]